MTSTSITSMTRNETSVKAHDYLVKSSQESIAIQEAFLQECGEQVVRAAQTIGESLKKGGKVLIFGNGGSAADAQHMAAEMIGRMLVDRRPLPAIALTTDTSNLTAVANDFGYDQVFLKQVQALARSEDVVIAISTSGNSKNVVIAVQEARKIGCKVISLVGGSGGVLKDQSDICLNASRGTNSSRIQESHIFAVHSMVDLLDRFFLT
jgi:D-sedoheptulose 7-phosphate isomerase